MDRVLQCVPDAGLRVKMDALVQDLTQALEETSGAKSANTSNRVKGGFRRRTRSTGNLGGLVPLKVSHHSEDSGGDKMHRSKEFSSFVQSDSDEMSATSHRVTPYPLTKRLPFSNQAPLNIESDSVNENFSPLRTGRRKRKMKRIDLETVELGPPRLMEPRFRALPVAVPLSKMPGTSGIVAPLTVSSGGRRKKVTSLGKDAKERIEAIMGKRKRGFRERSMGVNDNRPCTSACYLLKSKSNQSCHHLHRQMKRCSDAQSKIDSMELDKEFMSSSSLSSSESDAGLYTNDEGREGDDEQSDWVGDSQLDGVETEAEGDESMLQSLISNTLDNMTSATRDGNLERLFWLNEGNSGRDIRGGRRRVRSERITFASEKLSKFLQDGQQDTLKLHPMDVDEQEQLVQLVNKYSLNMRVEVSADGECCPVLSKTSATPHSILQCDTPNLYAYDFKKRRKMPQCGKMVPESDMDIT